MPLDRWCRSRRGLITASAEPAFTRTSRSRSGRLRSWRRLCAGRGCRGDHFVFAAEPARLVLLVKGTCRRGFGELTVLQVLVLVLDVDVDVVVDEVVVVAVLSSRQPHHPGVLQVSVLVLEYVELVAVDVVGCVCVPFSYFHNMQSTQSTSSSIQGATLSYTL